MKKLHKMIAVVTAAVSMAVVPVCSAFAASGIVNASTLNVRSGPGTGYGVVTQVSGGTSVEVISSSNGWYKINNGGVESYVDGRYVTLTSADASLAEYYDEHKYGKVTASALNVREAANVSCSVIGKVYNGACVEIIGRQNGFVIVMYNNQYGYMSEEYIQYITADEFNAAASAASSTGNRAVDIAMQYIGVPYVYGGTTPSGFDCSGFTSYVYRQLGYSLNRTAAGQASNGTVVASKADLQPGDLLLFQSSGYGGIGHVGIYIGNGNMIHAPKPGAYVSVTSINTSYYNPRYVGARRFA